MRAAKASGKIILIFAIALALAGASGCTALSSGNETAISFEAMDTFMTITVYGEDSEEAAQAAKEEIERLDALLSAEDTASEVALINAAGEGELSEDLQYLIEASLLIYEETDGAFDITVYPLSVLWGFADGNYAVPSEDELNEALQLCGSDRLEYDSESGMLYLDEGMMISFGAIAKGYSGDRIMEIFEGYELDGAIASLGGNIVLYGEKTDKSLWSVAIQDPADSSEYVCVLELSGGKSVVTSGSYERYFEEDGIIYHHIINPETGYPADSNLSSVTVVCGDGTAADALSTALFVMGEEEAAQFWRDKEDYDFEMVLVDEDGGVYITEGLAGSYTSEHEVEIISR